MRAKRAAAGAACLLGLLVCPGASRTPQQSAPVDVLAYCIYNEAKGESWQGMHEVAAVIENRARFKHLSDLKHDRPETLRRVVLQRGQFAGARYYVPGDFIAGKNYEEVPRRLAYILAGRLCSGALVPTSYATHFYSGAAPPWTSSLFKVHVIGAHTFGTMPSPLWN